MVDGYGVLGILGEREERLKMSKDNDFYNEWRKVKKN